MIIYHLLSNDRLKEKNLFARNNGGQLLLTEHHPSMDVTDGQFGPYIHGLKYLVTGISFASNQSLRAIKIELDQKKELGTYIGPQADCDFSKYSKYAVSEFWFEDEFVWHEIILSNTNIVTRWTSDQKEIHNDFDNQMKLLKERKIGRKDFFYCDFFYCEQIVVAKIIGARLGLIHASDGEIKEWHRTYDEASARIGAL